ncbi:hypothetical protein K8I28_05460 [bacterium]|nr:hypothetical protein [bacterium]
MKISITKIVIPIFLTLLLVLPQVGVSKIAYHRFSGTVRDIETSLPVMFARVELLPLGQSFSTNETGNFNVFYPHDQVEYIRVSAPGYLRQQLAFDEIKYYPINIKLEAEHPRPVILKEKILPEADSLNISKIDQFSFELFPRDDGLFFQQTFEVVDNKLFLVAGDLQLKIFSLADQSKPELLSSTRLPPNDQIVVHEEKVYCPAHKLGLWVLDISDPTSPEWEWKAENEPPCDRITFVENELYWVNRNNAFIYKPFGDIYWGLSDTIQGYTSDRIDFQPKDLIPFQDKYIVLFDRISSCATGEPNYVSIHKREGNQVGEKLYINFMNAVKIPFANWKRYFRGSSLLIETPQSLMEIQIREQNSIAKDLFYNSTLSNRNNRIAISGHIDLYEGPDLNATSYWLDSHFLAGVTRGRGYNKDRLTIWNYKTPGNHFRAGYYPLVIVNSVSERFPFYLSPYNTLSTVFNDSLLYLTYSDQLLTFSIKDALNELPDEKEQYRKSLRKIHKDVIGKIDYDFDSPLKKAVVTPETLWILDENGNLYCFDIVNPIHPSFITKLHPEEIISEIICVDGFIYLAAGKSGLLLASLNSSRSTITLSKVKGATTLVSLLDMWGLDILAGDGKTNEVKHGIINPDGSVLWKSETLLTDINLELLTMGDMQYAVYGKNKTTGSPQVLVTHLLDDGRNCSIDSLQFEASYLDFSGNRLLISDKEKNLHLFELKDQPVYGRHFVSPAHLPKLEYRSIEERPFSSQVKLAQSTLYQQKYMSISGKSYIQYSTTGQYQIAINMDIFLQAIAQQNGIIYLAGQEGVRVLMISPETTKPQWPWGY